MDKFDKSPSFRSINPSLEASHGKILSSFMSGGHFGSQIVIYDKTYDSQLKLCLSGNCETQSSFFQAYSKEAAVARVCMYLSCYRRAIASPRASPHTTHACVSTMVEVHSYVCA